MADIVLSTLNAKFIHAAFGLRYLLANLGLLRARARLIEFDINQRPLEIAEAILAEHPKILGLGVYIWNATPTTELVAILKRVRPELTIILGGPEVSHEWEALPVVQQADFVITGEGDLKFAQVCRQLLSGQRPAAQIIPADLPALDQLQLPYDLYTDCDLSSRLIYVEASRGCPFECDFCLSALDIPVRQFPLDRVLAAFQGLLDRGARHFKFVDRTFNLNLRVSEAILDFFLARLKPGLFLHFEMAPDRLPASLRQRIAQFPAGSLQLEVGIQTFNPEVAARIHRRQDYAAIEDNLRFLRQQTGAYLHTDLIVGLPGETIESFAAGFDRLAGFQPHEIQIGILKRLRGAPIAQHDARWGMVYNPQAPYEILRNMLLDFETLQCVRRFARVWDLVANSGNFLETAPLTWSGQASAFAGFMAFTEWLHQRVGRGHGIALLRLNELVFHYLNGPLQMEPRTIAPTLLRDYQRAGRSDVPVFLRQWIEVITIPGKRSKATVANKRQTRRLKSDKTVFEH